MIYTCTTNPSLDYYLSLSNPIELNQTNRSDAELYDAGGKGVNVSIVLNNLHIPSKAIGFLGGFIKDYYLSFMNKYPYVEPQFTSIEGNTRINIKVMSAIETSINARGPHIKKEEFERFKKRIRNVYQNDIFVLSGNVQEEIFDDMVALIKDLSEEGLKIVLDTDALLVKACLPFKPYLVRPNLFDLETITGKEDHFEACKAMIEMGAERILLSNRYQSSYLFFEDQIYTSKLDDANLVNTTGTADSMVAGYLYSIQRGADHKEAFRYANAAGLATSYSNDLASREKIEKYFETIAIERI